MGVPAVEVTFAKMKLSTATEEEAKVVVVVPFIPHWIEVTRSELLVVVEFEVTL